MKVTAEAFRQKPQKVYKSASKGETVTINHDRYPEEVFELTARPREPLKEEDFKPSGIGLPMTGEKTERVESPRLINNSSACGQLRQGKDIEGG